MLCALRARKHYSNFEKNEMNSPNRRLDFNTRGSWQIQLSHIHTATDAKDLTRYIS